MKDSERQSKTVKNHRNTNKQSKTRKTAKEMLPKHRVTCTNIEKRGSCYKSQQCKCYEMQLTHVKATQTQWKTITPHERS